MPFVLRALLSGFWSVFSALVVGGAVIVVIEMGLLMWGGPGALRDGHRYLAPVLPGALVAALVAALPLAVLALVRRARVRRGGVGGAWTSQVGPGPGWARDDRVLLWLGVCVTSVVVGVVGSWAVFAHRLQLAWDAALVLGTGFAGLVALVLALVRRRQPPLPVLACGLIFGAWIAGGPFHRVAPAVALAPALALWLAAATGVGRYRHGAMIGATALVVALAGFGLWGYGADRLGAARVAKRSFVSAPLASGIRAVVDLDLDGVSGILGGGDCDDLDGDVHPGAVEVVGNGADDNCMGGDLEDAEVPATGAEGEMLAERAVPDGGRAVPDGGRAGPDEERAVPDERPDVLFITLDAVRGDHLTSELMPNLHALAEDGLYAPVAYTPAPYTGFAFIDTMTSNPTMDHHEDGLFYGYEPTLAQVLGAAGYRTVAVHCIVDLPTDMVNGFQWVDNTLGPRCKDFRRTSSSQLAEVAISYVRERDPTGRPLFLWVHFVDPHLPYIGGYEAELERTDEAIGELLAAVARPTIQVVFSDHGESFGLHGFEGHVWRLDEEMLRVVLFLHGPGVPGGVVPWPATLIDIAPTVTELLGIRPPPGWSGDSLLRDPGPRPILFQSDYRGELDLMGARLGDYKITHDRRSGTFEIYQVVDDPDDQHNLVDDAALFERLRHELGRVYDEVFNDRRIARKLDLLDERPVLMPAHAGPMVRGQAEDTVASSERPESARAGDAGDAGDERDEDEGGDAPGTR